MKSVLISIQPYYVFLIIARLMGWDIPQKKTIEIRKDYPKDSAWNKVGHIYCSKNKKSFNRIPKEYQPLMAKFLGKVIGEFVCDRFDKYESEFWNDTPDYMDKNHAMEQIRKSYFDDPDDCECEEEFEYVTGNEADNPDDCELCKQSCLTYAEIRKYIGIGDKTFYGCHISDLKIYDTPKELGKFRNPCKKFSKCEDCNYSINEELPFAQISIGCDRRIIFPPQSWSYVELLGEN